MREEFALKEIIPEYEGNPCCNCRHNAVINGKITNRLLYLRSYGTCKLCFQKTGDMDMWEELYENI